MGSCGSAMLPFGRTWPEIRAVGALVGCGRRRLRRRTWLARACGGCARVGRQCDLVQAGVSLSWRMWGVVVPLPGCTRQVGWAVQAPVGLGRHCRRRRLRPRRHRRSFLWSSRGCGGRPLGPFAAFQAHGVPAAPPPRWWLRVGGLLALENGGVATLPLGRTWLGEGGGAGQGGWLRCRGEAPLSPLRPGVPGVLVWASPLLGVLLFGGVLGSGGLWYLVRVGVWRGGVVLPRRPMAGCCRLPMT